MKWPTCSDPKPSRSHSSAANVSLADGDNTTCSRSQSRSKTSVSSSGLANTPGASTNRKTALATCVEECSSGLENEQTFDTLCVMNTGGVASPNADLDDLATSLTASFDVPLSALSDEELSERLERLPALTAQLDALRVLTISAADARDIGRLSGQRNVANHVAAVSNADPASVRFDERIADWLIDMPIIAGAFAAGDITIEHVELLRRVDNSRVHVQMIDAQELFVSWLTTVVFRDLKTLFDEWLLGADPDGAEPTEHSRETGMTVKTVAGGMVKVAITMDPLQGAAFDADLSGECARLREQERETGERRTVRKRQLCALLNLTGRGAVRPNGSHARPRVHIVMSVSRFARTSLFAPGGKNALPQNRETLPLSR